MQATKDKHRARGMKRPTIENFPGEAARLGPPHPTPRCTNTRCHLPSNHDSIGLPPPPPTLGPK
eukprot:scaffold10467_cov36-Tisochrysis_lutea.AAC.1